MNGSGPSRERSGCRGGRSFPPEHRAEAPRVAVAQTPPVVESPVDVIVRTGRNTARYDSKASGHSEVNERGPVAGAREEVLCPPGEPGDQLALEPLAKLRGNRPAQARLPDQDPLHAPPDQSRFELAAGRLDFGQFRHARRPVPSTASRPLVDELLSPGLRAGRCR